MIKKFITILVILGVTFFHFSCQNELSNDLVKVTLNFKNSNQSETLNIPDNIEEIRVSVFDEKKNSYVRIRSLNNDSLCGEEPHSHCSFSRKSDNPVILLDPAKEITFELSAYDYYEQEKYYGISRVKNLYEGDNINLNIFMKSKELGENNLYQSTSEENRDQFINLESNSDLENIIISSRLSEKFIPILDEKNFSFQLNLEAEVKAINITPIMKYNSGIVNINHNKLESGEVSRFITLNLGPNLIEIITTSINKTNSKKYSLNIQRGGQYLKSFNSDSKDFFGSAVDIYDNYLLVGAPQEDSSSEGDNNLTKDSGAAYLFRKNQNSWQQIAFLKGSDLSYGDNFGKTVALDKKNLVIGAPHKNNNSGAIYIFEKDQNNNWIETANLKGHNTEPGDFFSNSLSLHNNVIVVGAYGESGLDNNFSDSGAIYIFEKDQNNNWIETAYLKGDNTSSYDQFGWHLAIEKDIIAVIANLEDGPDDFCLDSGALYLFQKNQGVWGQTSYLRVSNNNLQLDKVAVSSSLIALNSIEPDNKNYSGEIYFFEKTGPNDWNQIESLKRPEIFSEKNFGETMILEGNFLLTSLRAENNLERVYLWHREEDEWQVKKSFCSPINEPNLSFGQSLTISKKGTIAIGLNDHSKAQGINPVSNPKEKTGQYNQEALHSGAVYLIE